MPARPGLQTAEDMQLLEDVQAEKENEIIREIKQNIAKHAKWNEDYVDFTREPLSPPPEGAYEASFRPAITTQLPTPPSSDSSDNMMDTVDSYPSYLRDKLGSHHRHHHDHHHHHGVNGNVDDGAPHQRLPSFRRRIGRGGRLMIDRRNLTARNSTTGMNPWMMDRFKYDQEDSDDEEPTAYERNKYDIQIMQHRAIMTAKARDQAVAAAQAQAQAAQVQAQRRLQADQINNRPMGPSQGHGAAGSGVQS